MRLFHHFANLLEHDGRRSVTFRKRYDAICTEWLGGLTVLAHKSKIETEQLGSHLAALVGCGFLKSYALDRARDGEGFVLTFRPGAAFFDGYERFYKRRHQGELQFRLQSEGAEIHNPLSLVRRFHELRTGQTLNDVEFSKGEVDFARKLISMFGHEPALSFVEYGLSQARSTAFPVQTLSGLKPYVPDFQKDRQALSQAKEAAARKLAADGEQRGQVAYDQFRSERADAFFASAPAEIKARIEEAAIAEARARSARFPKMYDAAFRLARRRLVLEHFPIPSFEEWRSSKAL